MLRCMEWCIQQVGQHQQQQADPNKQAVSHADTFWNGNCFDNVLAVGVNVVLCSPT